MIHLEDGMYSYGEMSFESHVSVPNIMLGLQDSMISSTSGFLFFIDGSQMTSLHMNTSHPLNTTFIQKTERMAMGEYYWLSQTS
jgi:hypothetical protein